MERRRFLVAGASMAALAALAPDRLRAAQASSSPDGFVLRWPDIGRDWTDGLPVANGPLGAMMWARGDDVVVSIDRNDAWDLRPVPEFEEPGFTYANLVALRAAGDTAEIARLFEKPFHTPGRGKLPIGRIALGLKADEVAGTTLDLGAGTAMLSLKDGTTLTLFLAADGPVGVLRAAGPRAAAILAGARIEAPPFGERGDPPAKPNALDYGGAAELGYPRPRSLAGEGASGYVTGAANDFFAALARPVEGAAALAWTVVPGDSLDAAAAGARAALAPARDAKALAGLERRHRRWWNAYWSRVRLGTGDAALDRRWRLSTYHMGAAARAGEAPIPLQAPWTWDNGKLPAWKGDYHHDLNTQMTYWPVYAGNRPEQSANFVDWLWATRDECRDWTRRFFGVEGLNVPGSADILNRPLGGWAPNSYALTTGAWLLHHVDLHERYFGDRAYLETRAYPYAAEVVRFLGAMLRERPGRQGLFLPLSTSPEINDNRREAWFEEWTNFDLALVRYAFGTAARMADALGRTADAERHRAVLPRLPEFALDADGGFAIAAGTPLTASHRHFSHLLAFYPLRLLDPATDPAALRALDASLARLERLGTKMWMGYSFAWLASLYAMAGRGADAVRAMRTFEEGFSGRNGFHTNGDRSGKGITAFPGSLFTLEGGNAAAAAVQDMLLQSRPGVVRLFPAMPAGATARFEHLRADGGIDVSARLEHGRVVGAELLAARPTTVTLGGPGLDPRPVRLAAGRAWRLA